MLSKRTWIVILFLIVLKSNENHANVACPVNSEIGEKDPKKKADHLDSETGVAILLNQDHYKFSCCGFIYQWDFHAENTGTFDAQVWRHDSGDVYQLVGANTLNSTNPKNNEQSEVANGNRIRPFQNDYIGLHSTGSFIITYKDEGGGKNRLKLTGQTSAMTSPKDWSSANNDNQKYAVNALVTASENPQISTVTGVSYYNDELSVGSIAVTIAVNDPDEEDMDELTLTITNVDNSGFTYFEITSSLTNYNISVKALPAVNMYSFNLKAEDPCTKSGTGTHTITILNRLPVMNNLPESISISEDTGADELLFIVNATDTVTDPINCTMNTGDTSAFKVETDYGVYTQNPGITFDHDSISSYTVTVRCDDGDDHVDGVLTINLIRNEPPVMNNLPESTSFLEDLNTNTRLHTINVTDATGDAITCTLDPTSAIFDVSLIPPGNTEYGIYLTGGTTLDYDTTPSYSLSVKCSDHRRSDTDTFIVNLVRNTPPVINSLPDQTSISEDSTTKTLVYTLNVTDVNAADTVTCWLKTNTGIFEINEAAPGSVDYAVFLLGGTILNYDVTPSYSLTIECGDHRRNVTGVLTVDVIPNEPPTIANLPMSCEITEDTVNEILLYTVSVTDPTNDTVTCTTTTTTSIFYLQGGSSQFEVEIYVRGNQVFSYDTQRSYTLDIVCADQKRNDSEVFYIYILRNNPPSFTNLQDKTTVSAKTAATGDSIFTVLASDPENNQLQFSMTSDNVGAPFSIDLNTGEVFLSRSIQTEKVSGYDLHISVTDSRNIVGPKTLTVTITDINTAPTFKNVPQTLTVLEGNSIGKEIFQPVIYDPDLTNNHTYTVVYDPPEGAVYFSVDAFSGSVTTIVDIDYETISSKTFVLMMTVSDSLSEDLGNITLNILNVNEPPKFTKKYYSLSASEGNGGAQLPDPYYQYTDEDGDSVTFSFSCGQNTGRLDMDQTTGILSYSSLSYDLDVSGTDSELSCEVYINDNDYNDTAFLNITILEDNDNEPVFEHSDYTFFVPIYAAVGTGIGNVQAADSDFGTYGDLHYHISQQSLGDGLFQVESDCSLSLLQSLDDYGEGSVLNFTVYAVDSGGRQNLTVVNIVIPVTTETTTPVDNTIQYYTFFSYAPNMAWFVPLMFILFGTVCFVIHTVATGDWSCLKKIRKQKKIRRRKQRQKTDSV